MDQIIHRLSLLIVFLLFSFLFCFCFFFSGSNTISSFDFTKLGHPLSKFELQTRYFRSYGDARAALSVINSTKRFGNSTSIQMRIVRGNIRDVEVELSRARDTIRRAMKLNVSTSFSDDGDAPISRVYRHPGAFYQSYLEMEKRFKVYVYEEGERPIVHDGPCKNIYTSEGRFIHEMELGKTRFRTSDASRAHVYFMPFSVTMMVEFLYKGNDEADISTLLRFVSDYVKVVSTKYLFWNRTQGADHFMLSCHDWGPMSSAGDPVLYSNSIRVLCNANTSEGFNPIKDVSLPEINLYTGDMPSDFINVAGDDSRRPYLAFFAGRLHGPIRPILLNHWRNKDPDLLVYNKLPKGLSYYSFMLKSKFCLCPSGYEVASPRITEAIYAECVPVIISDHYVLPFSDVLRWEMFSVRVDPDEIPRLKEVLSVKPAH